MPKYSGQKGDPFPALLLSRALSFKARTSQILTKCHKITAENSRPKFPQPAEPNRVRRPRTTQGMRRCITHLTKKPQLFNTLLTSLPLRDLSSARQINRSCESKAKRSQAQHQNTPQKRNPSHTLVPIHETTHPRSSPHSHSLPHPLTRPSKPRNKNSVMCITS